MVPRLVKGQGSGNCLNLNPWNECMHKLSRRVAGRLYECMLCECVYAVYPVTVVSRETRGPELQA